MRNQLFKNLTILTALFLLAIQTYASNFTKEPDGVKITLKKGLMKVFVCDDNIIRVTYTLLDTFPAKPSLVVNAQWKTPAFEVVEKGNLIILSTASILVSIDISTGAIDYKDKQGHLLLSESQPDGKIMTPASIAGISTYNCTTTFNSPADEALYGLGCHPLDNGAINYKGRNQDLAIRYLTGAIPVLLSTRGYGLLWDNYSPSNFYGGEAANTQFKYVSESGKMIDYYFFYGPNFDKIIAAYRKTTGTAPMYGRWAFGLFQSQDRYMTQEEVLTVKDKYRNNHIPVDCIVQDWFYWTPNPIGSHIMNPANYPDPKKMVDELHKAHLHAMISIWPCFGVGTRNFDELSKAGGMTDITWDNVMTHTFDHYYDAHSKTARDLYWREAKDSLIGRYGWDAWWIDQCEPDNGSLLDARRQSNFALGKGIDYFNTYSLMHTSGLYEGWRRDLPGKRLFFLSRQAFAGQQRNATTLWSSDITCTFASLRIQVPQGINACASGMPYWTSDIGGYHYNWNKPDWSTPNNRELFTRWFQFGTFCPIFRIHGKGERALFSDNWDTHTKEILLNFDNLRYRLLPYIYSLSAQVTQKGYTLMRALAFDFKNDSAIYDIKDQYMFGPAFLVNPVTDSMYYTGADGKSPNKSRNVYLPKGTVWYDFWTGKKLEGGVHLTAEAPIEILPLYVKAGSVIPMGPVMEYATEKTDYPFEVRIYPGADGSFTVYEDDNDTYNYEKGEFSTYDIQWKDKERKVIISARKGSFPGMINGRKINIILVNEKNGNGVAAAGKISATLTYSGKEISQKL